MDNLIKRAIIAAARIETNYYVNLPESDTNISEEMDKKIRDRTNGKQSRAHIAPRRWVAILIAAALLLSLSLTAFAFKEQMFDFVETFFEGYVNIKQSPNKSYISTDIYIPTYLPENYTESSKIQTNIYDETIWRKGEKSIIFSVYKTLNTSTNIDTSKSEYSKLTIDDKIVHCVLNHERYMLYWNNDKVLFELCCPEELGIAEIEKIIRSVEMIEE